ncbi:MAG TPA: hypothetical protein VEC93_05575 [Anaerolineae bacterium]|nr:hypothetical protein [Anaerolineae bacterium]
MSFEQIRLTILIIVITLISGLADSWGFIHSAKIWQEGKLVWTEVGKAALGFGVGISLYWFMLKYMTELGVVSPEIQAIFWFGLTLIGTAIASGAFREWARTEQVVAVAVLLGIGWLILRTGG